MITPSVPIPLGAVANWKLDAIGVRIYDKRVALLYGGYDTSGNRVAERQFILTADSTPSVQDFIAACPAGPTFKQQAETFGVTLDPQLGGSVS